MKTLLRIQNIFREIQQKVHKDQSDEALYITTTSWLMDKGEEEKMCCE